VDAQSLNADAERLEKEMLAAAKDLRFEEAAAIRDELHEVVGLLASITQEGVVTASR
jgi:excinuclease UvrABC helicase subunit UvrB